MQVIAKSRKSPVGKVQFSRLYKLFLLVLGLCCEEALWAEAILNDLTANTYKSWFTGSLLAPTPVNMEVGCPLIQPIILMSSEYGKYDDQWCLEVKKEPVWIFNPSASFQFAFTKDLGLEVYGGLLSKFSNGEAAVGFQDTYVTLGYQISNDDKYSWVPNCRLDFQQVFPSGRYNKLSADKISIEAMGSGSYQTGGTLILQKLFYLKHQRLAIEWSFNYLHLFPTSVSGFNAYGGGIGTIGKVSPGDIINAFCSGQLSISEHWGIGLDTMLFWQGSSLFEGKKGQNSRGKTAEIGYPAQIQLSIAPSVEFTMSKKFGLLFGAWFSVYGQNSTAFAALSLDIICFF